jgi:hypothetical protein
MKYIVNIRSGTEYRNSWKKLTDTDDIGAKLADTIYFEYRISYIFLRYPLLKFI